jgi:hypothetical protein
VCSSDLFYHTDLVEACKWLKPRLKDTDAVFCTTLSMNMPYVITLVTLGYDPDRWFRDRRDFFTEGEWEYYKYYGKMYFMYDDSSASALSALQQDPLTKQVFFIVRPGELNFTQPVYRITHPDGYDTLWICRLP